MPENTNVEVLFFNGRAVGVTLPNFIEQAVRRGRPWLPRRHRHRRHQAGQHLHRRHASTCRSSSTSATSSRSTRAPGSTSSASAAPSCPDGGRPRASLEARARIVARCAPGSRRGVPRGLDAGACPLAGAGGPPRRDPGRTGGERDWLDHLARVPPQAAGRGRAARASSRWAGAGAPRVGPAPPDRVHDGRVVPGERAARGAGRRLRGAGRGSPSGPRGAIRSRWIAAPFARTTVRAAVRRARRASR